MRRGRTVGALVACSVGLSMGFSPVATADWSAPWTVAPRGASGPPIVAPAPGDGAYVGWVEGSAGPLRVRRVNAHGRPGKVITLARATSSASAGPWIASRPSGALVAVWHVDVPDLGWSLRMRRLTAQGSLGRVRVVADSRDLSRSPEFSDVQVKMHPDSSATVVWEEVRGHSLFPKGFAIAGATVHARHMGSDGRLEPILDVAEADEIAPMPSVAAGPGRRATVVWQARANSKRIIRTATIDGTGVGAVQDVSEPLPYGSTHGPGIFANARGVGLATWNSLGTPEIGGRRMAGGVALGSPLAIFEERTSFGVAAVVDANGKATVAWRQVGVPEKGFINQALFRHVLPDGRPTPLLALSATHDEVSNPAVAIDRRAAVTASWTTIQRMDDDYRYAVQVRRIAAHGRPGAIHTLERSQTILHPPAVVSDRRGRAMVIWSSFNRNGWEIRASRYVAGCSKSQLRYRKRTSGRPPTHCG